MFDVSKVYQLLGLDQNPDPPHHFEITGLGYLVLEEKHASIVIKSRIADLEMLKACSTANFENKLPTYLSTTPGGFLCHHFFSHISKDETDILVIILDSEIRRLSSSATI